MTSKFGFIYTQCGGRFYNLEMTKFFLVPPPQTSSIWAQLKFGLLIFQVPGATWPVFKILFLFFEHEGVPYNLKVLKIILNHNKKIFNLSYCTGLYDQNCRIYPQFYIFRYTGPMVTRYTGGLSQLPVVEISWGKNLRKNLVF